MSQDAIREQSAPRFRWIGRPVRPREDLRFLRGQGTYVDDLVLPRMAHMVVVRSPVAHAVLRRIDVEAARRAPGVVRVVTAQDLAGRLAPLPANVVEGAQVAQIPHPALAAGKVRYVGQPVAAVVAETAAAAADAAGLVAIDYDPLPAVIDPRSAAAAEVRLHETLGDNVLVRWSRRGGDVAKGFRDAARVVRGRFHIPRLVGAPMEPRGAVASYDPGADLLTVWCSQQDPHRPLAQLSRALRRPEDRIRVVVPDVGGGFGIKGAVAPETILAAALALDGGRPIKWIESRRENFQGAYQGRGVEAEVEMAVDDAGRILALRARLIADLGAYLYTATPVPPITMAMLLTGAYAIPAAEAEVLGVATNKVPTGPYRGAGRPEAAYIVERMVDLVAGELGLDPIELRRRNLIPGDRFPYHTPLGFVYDSGDYAATLAHALELAKYERWREDQRRARAAGRLVGVGAAFYVERAGSQLWESAAVAVDPAGRVVVRTGSTPAGQGHETTFSQIAAEVLPVDLASVAVLHGDSAVVPRGMGTFGSRSTTIGGSAVWLAAEKVAAKARRIAAHLLEASEGDIEIGEAGFAVRGAPGRAVEFRDVAQAAYQPARLPPGMEMGLEATARFALPGPVFPSGACVAVVELDRESGEVRLLTLAAVDDAGRIVNPLLAEAQVLGAVVQGVGQALAEEAVYDPAGQLVTGTFADYGLLRAARAPALLSEFRETLSPLNPLGAKGIGEAGTIAAPAAVANAVMDALAPLGIRHVDFPLGPEKLWRLLRSPSH